MKIVGAIFGTLLIALVLGYSFIPGVRKMINEYVFLMERVDEETDYTNRKMVEDSARAMMANYQYAKEEYYTYRIFCQPTTEYNEVKCQRALDARSSANKTVSTYNEYMIKNKFLFKDNMPSDIKYELSFIREGD